MLRRFLSWCLVAACSALAQTYDGPRPAKPDLPYLKHAERLIPTEAVIAKEDSRKKNTAFVIDGASSAVETPLASPVFLLKADKIVPEALELYRLESKDGKRSVVPTKQPPIRVEVTRLTPDHIWRVEVDESLEPGEYSLTVRDDPSNQAWCFRVR